MSPLDWAELIGVEDAAREVVLYVSYDTLVERTRPMVADDYGRVHET